MIPQEAVAAGAKALGDDAIARGDMLEKWRAMHRARHRRDAEIVLAAAWPFLHRMEMDA